MKSREARMDLVTWSPVAPEDLWIDFTARHPCAARCVKAAAKKQGVAAKRAVTEKNRRYGPKVLCTAVETYGYQGDGVAAFFEALAGQAPKPASAAKRRTWRMQLGMTLARCVARSVRESAGHSEIDP